MKKWRFFGGIHPAYNKELASGSATVEMPTPRELVVYLSQNLGAPSKPVVKKGDAVKKGQMIAEAGGFVSTPMHAPTSGTIKAVEKRPFPLGPDMEAFIIEPDGLDEWAEGRNVERPVEGLEPAAIRSIVHECGIVGLGGATFPTHVKLSPPEGRKIDLLIINGAECEPYLTADHRLMLERPQDIIEGASLLARVIGVERVIIAVEKNKPDAIAAMRDVAKGREGYGVASMDVIYPQGAEKQLIYALSGRKVPAGGLPMDVGVLVQNVGTAAAAFEAARFNRPLIRRIVTVTGSGVRKPGNVLALVGTKFEDLLEFCGGIHEDTGKVINGGPMMGVAQPSLEAALMKGTSGLVLLRRDEAGQYVGDPCIRCGRCVESCPMGLNPSAISIFTERLRFEDAAGYNVMDCIECGCCAYVCPSRRPMVHHFRRAKAEIRKMPKKTG